MHLEFYTFSSWIVCFESIAFRRRIVNDENEKGINVWCNFISINGMLLEVCIIRFFENYGTRNFAFGTIWKSTRSSRNLPFTNESMPVNGNRKIFDPCSAACTSSMAWIFLPAKRDFYRRVLREPYSRTVEHILNM